MRLIEDDPAMYSWILISSDGIGEQVRHERLRAHDKHRDHSMESWPIDAPDRYLILAEEVGEVAKEFNDAKVEGRDVDTERLHAELVQVAAMAVAWAASIEFDRPYPTDSEDDRG